MVDRVDRVFESTVEGQFRTVEVAQLHIRGAFDDRDARP
jgi:hypothetical protein